MKLKKTIIIIAIIIVALFLFNYIRIIVSYNMQKDILEETIDIQGIDELYVPQGIAYSSRFNVFLQTSYNSNHSASKLYVIDFDTGNLIKALKLKKSDDTNNTSHVGGITTDDDKVWISSDFELCEYSLDTIMETKEQEVMSLKDYKLANRGDFCYYHDNILWIGDFHLKILYELPEKKPLLMGYEQIEEVNYSNPDFIVAIPDMVQGMAITEDNKFVFSRSYSGLIRSEIALFDDLLREKTGDYSLNGENVPYYASYKEKLLEKKKIPPMAEGIMIKDKELFVLFESGSKKYKTAFPKIRKILKLKETIW